MTEPARWTILTYIAAHNNLQAFGLRSLQQIIDVGSTVAVRHGVLYDGPEGGARYLVGDPGLVLEQTPLDHFDSGDPDRLIETARYVFQRYPAEHYGLVLWSHGSGWQPEELATLTEQARGDQALPTAQEELRGLAPSSYVLFRSTLHTLLSQATPAERAILFDDGTGHSLDTLELERVTRSLHDALGQPLDLLGLDACLMATLEVAYQLRHTTRFLVASEELVPGHSWPYDRLFGDLRARPGQTPRELAQRAVQDYVAVYTAEPPAGGDVTQIALDLSRVEPLVQALTSLAEALSAQMGKVKQHLALAQNATQDRESIGQRRVVTKFQFHLWDLVSTARHLAQHCPQAQVQDAARQVCETFHACGLVVREGHYGSWFDGIGGLSIYLIPPKKGRQRQIAAAYSRTALAQDTHWDAMLRQYQG